MDKSKIPSIKLYSVFKALNKEELLNWIKEFSEVLNLEREWEEMSVYDISQELQPFYDSEEYHKVMHDRIMNDFRSYCGIGPKVTEEILECTTTERKRWVKEGKLPVLYEFNGGTKSRPIWIAMLCRYTIQNLTDEIIEQWRLEHENNKAMKRKMKENFQKKEAVIVEINAICEGFRKEKVFGPIYTTTDTLETIWQKHKGNIPFEWEDKPYSIYMIDYTRGNILKMEMSCTNKNTV